MPKFLPVEIQDFEKMILGDFVYVDKTRYVYDMALPLQALFFLAPQIRQITSDIHL